MTKPEKTSAIGIVLNGRGVSTAAKTLDELVAGQNFGELRVATALNGAFVPAARRTATPINDGDRVEIVSARQGG